MTVTNLTPENPVRLRECLTALARAAGTDATRFEFSKSETGNLVIFVTSSRHESEEAIARAVVDALESVQ